MMKSDEETVKTESDFIEESHNETIDTVNINQNDQNGDLQKQIQELTEKNIKLTKTNEDLNNRINMEYQKLAEQTASREKYYLIEYDKLKSQLKGEIASLHAEVDRLNSEIKQKELNDKFVLIQNERVLHIFSQLYNKSFKTLDEACTFIEVNPQINPISQKLNENPKEIDEDTKDLLLKLKREIKRRKTAEKVVLQLQTDLATKNQKEDTIQLNNEINELKEKLQKMEQEKKMADFEHQNLISIFEKKIEMLNNEIVNLRSKNVRITPEIEPISLNEFNYTKDNEEKMCHRHEELAEVNNDLRRELRTRRADSKTKEEQINSQNNEISKLEGKLSVYESRIKIYQEDNDELKQQNSELAKKLKNSESNLEKLNQKIKNLKQKKHQLENHVQELTKMISNQSDLHENQNNSNSDFEIYEEKIKNLQEELENTRSRLEIAEEQLVNPLDLTPNDVLSPTIFHPAYFDKDLTVRIDHIASNSSLQPATKIQSIYQEITRFYSEISGSLSDEIHELKTKLSDFNEEIVDFANQLWNVLIGTDYPFAKWNNNNNDEIISKIQTLMKDKEQKNNLQNKLKSLTNLICLLFDINDGNIEEHLKFVAEQLKDNKDNIAKLCEKIKKQKKIIKFLEKADNEELENLQKENSQLTQKLQIEESQNNNYKKDNELLKEKVMNVTKQLSENNLKLEEMKLKIDKEKDENIERYNTDIKRFNEKYTAQIKEITEKLNQSNEIVSKYECKIARLRKACDSQKETISQLREEIKNNNNMDKVNLQINSLINEKKEIENVFNEKISKLKEENDSMKAKISELSKSLESKIKEVKTIKNDLKAMQSQYENNIKLKDEEMCRNAKLLEEKINQESQNMKTKYNIGINQVKFECDAEKKKIYAFAASHLKQFFNPRDIIDENSFQKLILSVSDYLSCSVKANTI